MFEDSTFDSTGLQHGQRGRWLLLALGLNLAVVTSMVTIPLIWPQALPANWNVRELTVPAPGRMVEVHQPAAQTASVSPRAAVFQQISLAVPRTPPRNIDMSPGPPNVNPIDTTLGPDAIGTGTVGSLGTPVVFDPPKPVVVVAKPARFKVSGGVTDGLLIWRVAPVYPVIAKTAGISGTVVLTAHISKEGRIEELRVLSGNQMLTAAAIAAVQQWKYRPYLLNGDPVAVETTVNVVFSLGRN
jgi:periplasmic protein TonB